MSEYFYTCTSDRLLKSDYLDSFDDAAVEFLTEFPASGSSHRFFGVYSRCQVAASFASSRTISQLFSQSQLAEMVVENAASFEINHRPAVNAKIETTAVPAVVIETEIVVMETFNTARNIVDRENGIPNSSEPHPIRLHVVDPSDLNVPIGIYLGSQFMDEFFVDDRKQMRIHDA